jgi:hypothetical protein
MKKGNKKIWMGMWVIALIFGMTVIGCNNDPPEDPPKFPAAKGKLTINGLDNFNDKYVYVQGLAGSSVLVGLTDIIGYPSDIAYKLVKISSGKAEVPLYTANASASSYSNSYVAYSGNDTITSVSIILLNENPLEGYNASTAIMSNLGLKRLTSGMFSDGNMTVDWRTLGGTWTPNGASPIQLTEDQWANGNIPVSSGQQWFTFTATASTQYIHVIFGTLTDFYVQIYDSNGDTVGSNTTMSGSTRYTSRSLTSGQKYYIKVWPHSGNGAYQITFNTSSNSPVDGRNDTIQLTQNQWASGNIPTSGGEQWFTFTATAYTQYIHVSFGTLTGLNVQLYNSSGSTTGGLTNFSGSSYISRSLTSGQKYYIKVWSSSGNGAYQIAFNTSSSAPSTGGSSGTSRNDAIQLTQNQWASGNIPTSNGEQWFTFTATAYTQYIHVIFGTLTDLYVQVYNSNDSTVGSSTNMYGSTRYISRSLTSGQKYYIKVWSYSGNGAYQIAFNTSSSVPSASASGGGGGGFGFGDGGTHAHIFGSWTYFITTAYGQSIYTRSCTICGYMDTQYR